MAEDETLAAAKVKKKRPPYLTELKESLSRVKVIYEGTHVPFDEIKAAFNERSVKGAEEVAAAAYTNKKNRGRRGSTSGPQTIIKFTNEQILSLKTIYNRCLPRSKQDKLGQPVEVKRFLTILGRAANPAKAQSVPFLQVVHKNLVPRMTDEVLSSMKSFVEIISMIIPPREKSNFMDQLQVVMDKQDKIAPVVPPPTASFMVGGSRLTEGSQTPATKKDDAKKRESVAKPAEEQSKKKPNPVAILKRAVIMQTMENFYRSDFKTGIPQVVSLEKRLELERLFYMISSNGKVVTRNDFLEGFENALDKKSLNHLFSQYILSGSPHEADFELFCKIMLPRNYVIPDIPNPKSMTSTDIYESFFKNAEINEKSVPYIAVQADLAKLGETGDGEKLQSIARATIAKYPVDKPLPTFRIFGLKKTKKKKDEQNDIKSELKRNMAKQMSI